MSDTKRYLVLEVVDEVHDLTDLVATMREAGINGRALLSSGGYALNVRFPPRPLAKEVGTIKGTETVIYVTEGRS